MKYTLLIALLSASTVQASILDCTLSSATLRVGADPAKNVTKQDVHIDNNIRVIHITYDPAQHKSADHSTTMYFAGQKYTVSDATTSRTLVVALSPQATEDGALLKLEFQHSSDENIGEYYGVHLTPVKQPGQFSNENVFNAGNQKSTSVVATYRINDEADQNMATLSCLVK